MHRRAGACPPPCLGFPNDREGQALALRVGRKRKPLSHRRAGACPPPCLGSLNDREGQALALRARRHRKPLSHRRAGACPPPCLGSLNVREGQALALRVGRHACLASWAWVTERSRGTGPRATGWAARLAREPGLGYRTIARDRPSRYGTGGAIYNAFARDRPSRYGLGGGAARGLAQTPHAEFS